MALGDTGGTFSVCLHLGHHSVMEKVKQNPENTCMGTVLFLGSGLPREHSFKPSMEFSYKNLHGYDSHYNPSFLNHEGLGVLYYL